MTEEQTAGSEGVAHADPTAVFASEAADEAHRRYADKPESATLEYGFFMGAEWGRLRAAAVRGPSLPADRLCAYVRDVEPCDLPESDTTVHYTPEEAANRGARGKHRFSPRCRHCGQSREASSKHYGYGLPDASKLGCHKFEAEEQGGPSLPLADEQCEICGHYETPVQWSVRRWAHNERNESGHRFVRRAVEEQGVGSGQGDQ